MNTVFKKIVRKMNLDISDKHIGFHGNINSFILMNEYEKGRYYFENKILLIDDKCDDIKIIYYNIINNIYDYKLYVLKIKEIFNVDIVLNNDINNITIFYDYLLKLLDIENITKININDNDVNKFNYLLKDEINNYKNFKKIILKDISCNQD